MCRYILPSLIVFCSLLAGSANALDIDDALIITFDNSGSTEQSIIKGNTMYAVSDGQIQMKIQSGGDCVMYQPEEQVQITEKCDELAQKIADMTQGIRSQMNVTSEQMAMMRNMMGGVQHEPWNETEKRTIANLEARCFGTSKREYCVSGELEEMVLEEGFDGRRFAAAFDEMRESMGPMGETDKELDEIQKLGFPVWDVKTGTGNPGIPGWEMIPPAQRQQLLAQMGPNAPGAEGGMKLSSVERRTVSIDLPQYEKMSYEQYFQKMMNSAGMGGR